MTPINENNHNFIKRKTNLLNINSYESFMICLSSSTFLIPSIYAMYLKNPLGYLSLTCFGASIMFWFHPTYGWRRNLDFFMAKICGVSYFLAAYQGITNPSTRRILYGTMWTYLICFYTANNLHKNNNPYWVYFHMGFHSIVSFGKCLILYNLPFIMNIQ
jgi:hypothetical protein